MNGLKAEVRLRRDKRDGDDKDTSVGDKMYVIHETAKGVGKAVIGCMAAYFLFKTANYAVETSINEAVSVRGDKRYEARFHRLEDKAAEK